jgi:hypothetical protein
MSEAAPLLHNSGWAPRATLVWNGLDRRTPWPLAGRGDDSGRPRWQTLRCDLDRPAPVAPGQPPDLLACPGADPCAALLQLLGVAPAGSPDVALGALIDERIRTLRLPAVIPVEPHIDRADLTRDGVVPVDLLTIVALQARAVGRLLVRDGDNRLARVQHITRATGTDGGFRFQWILKLYMDGPLRDRIAAATGKRRAP